MEHFDVKGERFPVIGFGTSGLYGGKCTQMVRTALDLGYRHIDTAQGYGNEDAVGKALRKTDVGRADIFVATKVWMANLRPSDVVRSTEKSLRKLKTDYVDLLIVHWPNDEVPFAETWTALEGLRDQGKARHLGVSNFTMRHMRDTIEACGADPFCNQIEYHVRIARTQAAMREYLATIGTALVAYSPLARGLLPGDARLAEIGAPYGKSASQVALRWIVQQGAVAITKSSSEAHCRDSIDIFDFALSPSDLDAIATLDDATRVIDPGWAPAWS